MNNTNLIKAVGFYKKLDIGHPDAFLDVRIPYPNLKTPFDIIVQVEAVSINPADIRARNRKLNDNKLTILGWDVAGTIVDLGVNVSPEFKLGDKVFYAGDINRSGGNSEFHAVDSRIVARAPNTISSTEAAALALVSLTAWEALFEKLEFPFYEQGATELLNNVNTPHSKQSILIIGGAGGVGSMLIQLAKLIPQLTIIATASRKESKKWCFDLGADYVIDHSNNIIVQLARIGYPEVDCILICNSPDQYFNILNEIIAPFGKICSIVPFNEKQDFNILMRKSVSFFWEFMFTRSSFSTVDMYKQSKILNSISKLIDNKRIISPIQKILYPLNAKTVKEGHKLMETNRSIGKIVIVAR